MVVSIIYKFKGVATDAIAQIGGKIAGHLGNYKEGEGRVDVMKTLLKRMADANNVRSDNILALMTACVGGHVEAVR